MRCESRVFWMYGCNMDDDSVRGEARDFITELGPDKLIAVNEYNNLLHSGTRSYSITVWYWEDDK